MGTELNLVVAVVDRTFLLPNSWQMIGTNEQLPSNPLLFNSPYSFCEEWFTVGLKEVKGVIEVDYLLENLVANDGTNSIAVYVLSGQTKNDRINMIKRMNEYAKIVLSEYGMRRYAYELINRYTSEILEGGGGAITWQMTMIWGFVLNYQRRQ